MSLINEALKRAQALRTQQASDSLPQAQGSPPHPIAMPARPAPSTGFTFKVFAGMAVVALVFGGLMAYFIVRLTVNTSELPGTTAQTSNNGSIPGPESDKNQDVPAPESSSRSFEPARQPAQPAHDDFNLSVTDTVERLRYIDDSHEQNAKAVDELSVRGDLNPPTAPNARPADQPEPRAAITKPELTSIDQTPPADPVPPQPAELAPAAGPTYEMRVREYIDALEVRGIMGGGARALIFNKSTRRTQSYERGSLIDRILQIRIAVISEGTIVYEDERGTRYVQSF